MPHAARRQRSPLRDILAGVRQFHVSRTARSRYALDRPLFGFHGGVITADVGATRRLAARMNETRAREGSGAPAVTAGELYALGVLHEVFHAILGQFDEQLRPGAIGLAVNELEQELGHKRVAGILKRFGTEFPHGPASRGHAAVDGAGPPAPRPDTREARAEAVEELLLLALANGNPAAEPFRELFDDTPLATTTD